MSPMNDHEAREAFQRVAPGARPPELARTVIATARRRTLRTRVLGGVAGATALALGLGIAYLLPRDGGRDAVPAPVPSVTLAPDPLTSPSASESPTPTPTSTPTRSATASPSATPTGTPAPTPSGSASPTAVAPQPDPEAGSDKPDVGTMPDDFLLFDEVAPTEVNRNALMACSFASTDYPALERRVASRMGMWVSDSSESYEERAAIIFPDEASASALVDQIRAAGDTCAQDPPLVGVDKDMRRLTRVDPLAGDRWDQALRIRNETVLLDGTSVPEFAGGREMVVVRRGRSVTVVAGGIYFAQPITDPAQFTDLFNQTRENSADLVQTLPR